MSQEKLSQKEIESLKARAELNGITERSGVTVCKINSEVKYINSEVKEKYIDYSIDILVKLQAIKNHMKEIHKDALVINHGHIGDLARIDCDLIDIINYL